jgi:hypothetical protein
LKNFENHHKLERGSANLRMLNAGGIGVSGWADVQNNV